MNHTEEPLLKIQNVGSPELLDSIVQNPSINLIAAVTGKNHIQEHGEELNSLFQAIQMSSGGPYVTPITCFTFESMPTSLINLKYDDASDRGGDDDPDSCILLKLGDRLGRYTTYYSKKSLKPVWKNKQSFMSLLASFFNDRSMIPLGKISDFENLGVPDPHKIKLLPRYEEGTQNALIEYMKYETGRADLKRDFECVFVYDSTYPICPRFMSAPIMGLQNNHLRASALVFALRESGIKFLAVPFGHLAFPLGILDCRTEYFYVHDMACSYIAHKIQSGGDCVCRIADIHSGINASTYDGIQTAVDNLLESLATGEPTKPAPAIEHIPSVVEPDVELQAPITGYDSPPALSPPVPESPPTLASPVPESPPAPAPSPVLLSDEDDDDIEEDVDVDARMRLYQELMANTQTQ